MFHSEHVDMIEPRSPQLWYDWNLSIFFPLTSLTQMVHTSCARLIDSPFTLVRELTSELRLLKTLTGTEHRAGAV